MLNTMSKLRVGVVGVGHIGSNHARIYSELPEADFAAIYDTDASTSKDMSGKYNVAATTSLGDFANAVDAASIATPTSAHFEVARALLERGKHLLIEKPITENPAHAREL